MKSKLLKFSLCVVSLSVFFFASAVSGLKADQVVKEKTDSRLKLEVKYDKKTGAKTSLGTYKVYENRKAGKGRMLELKIMILHATDPNPAPDPVFILRGGPGVPAVDLFRRLGDPWMRKKRDIVLVNQRGTGGTNKLSCNMTGNDDNLQGYLDPIFDLEAFRNCMKELQERFDLTMYSTCVAMDDLNEIRKALGYDKINLDGTSYGTRAALIYIKRHPETVRTAILNGVAPASLLNPLHHAPSAQDAIDLLFAECAANPECNGAFPDLDKKLAAILKRLEVKPAVATVSHPVTREPVKVKLSLEAFVTTLRIMLYSVQRNRQVPMLIHQAYEGDFNLFAQAGLLMGRGVRNMISFGQLLCVICAEDVARMKPGDVERFTAGTFLGDVRVRTQMAVCDFWPQSELPEDYAEPVKAEVPVLMLSGTQDPVTPPRWAVEVARHLPNSLHIIVPGAHGIGGKCITRIMMDFLESGSAKGIDTSCTKTVKMPPFRLPKKKK